MNVLGINGSPRVGGNTDLLLDKVLSGAKTKEVNIEKVLLAKLKFSPCLECEKTPNDGRCWLKDDLQQVYSKIENSDIIILASPIFFGSLTAQTKMLIDRYQCLWTYKNIVLHKNNIDKVDKREQSRKRKGVFISVEASHRKDFFYNARSIVKNFFVTIDVNYQEELFVSGVDQKGSILNYPDVLEQAFSLGEKIVS